MKKKSTARVRRSRLIQLKKKRSILKKTFKPTGQLKRLQIRTPHRKVTTFLIEPELDNMIIKPRLGKILHAPDDPAGQMSIQATALKELGLPVSFCSYAKQGVHKYPEDLPSPIKNVAKSLHGVTMMKYVAKCAKEYDIFHFHSAQSLTKYSYLDLPLLKRMGKKIVMSFWGSGIRKASIAKQKNPFSRIKPWSVDEKEIHRRLQVLSRYVDAAIVLDHEMFEYVKGYFKKVFLIRTSVDYRKFTPLYPDVQNRRPLVIHAPSHRYIKGTDHIMKVVKLLKQKVDFDYVQIEKTSNANLLKWISRADILVDQLHLGIYGVVSVEAMLLGKPVISHIRTDLIGKYPANMPVVPANPLTFKKVLFDLIINPQERYELGVKGRNYAIEHHDPMKIARQLVTVYKSI